MAAQIPPRTPDEEIIMEALRRYGMWCDSESVNYPLLARGRELRRVAARARQLSQLYYESLPASRRTRPRQRRTRAVNR